MPQKILSYLFFIIIFLSIILIITIHIIGIGEKKCPFLLTGFILSTWIG